MRAGSRISDCSAATTPAFSVVVTAFNYGHFLGSCLESLLAQTLAPREIVVVDDGSTDGTARVLRAHAGRVRAIRTVNRGQAAAFNTGFAASSGDVVLFVDADDRLHPEALETLLHHWSDEFAVLTFGLELIDETGRSTGVHQGSLCADVGDNRPRLLETGTFNFPPTSGNAFSRQVLGSVLPMPQERWRISADCYLIRAAALLGRFGHVPRVLGSYRLHGANNYASTTQRPIGACPQAADQRDVADALRHLAERAAAWTKDAETATALAHVLRHRAQLVEAEFLGPAPQEPQSAWRERIRAALFTPRWPVHLPADRWINPHGSVHRGMVLTDPLGALAKNCILCVSVDPAPAGRILALRIAPGEKAEGWIEVTLDGCPTWRGPVGPDACIRVPIEAAPWEAQRILHVELCRCGVARSDPAAGAIRIIGIHLTGRSDLSAPYVAAGPTEPVGVALAAGLDPAEWVIDGGGGATLRGSEGVLRFTTLVEPCAAVFDFSAAPPAGWLSIIAGRRSVFAGASGAARLELRLRDGEGGGRCELRLHFEPDAAGGDALRIARFGVVLCRGLDGHVAPRRLNLGEVVNFGHVGTARNLLRDGWHANGAEAVTSAAEATMSFRAPEHATAMRLVLALAPVLASKPPTRHLVGISVDGTLAASVELAGDGAVGVPLPDAVAGRTVVLGLHSVLLEEDGASAVASLALESMTLSGTGTAAPCREHDRPHAETPAVQALLDRAAALCDPAAPWAEEVEASAARFRGEITQFLAHCAPSALLLLAAAPERLLHLVMLGEAARHVPSTKAETRALAAVAEAASDEVRARMRAALLSLLHLPAFASHVVPELDHLPAPLLLAPGAIARYLGRTPELQDTAAHARYFSYLERLLGSIDRILALADKDSASFSLAAATLQMLCSTPMIFGHGSLRSLIALRGRCIARLLTRQGAQLAMPREPRAVDGPLRLGVLVRDVLPNPEGWALLGMYAGLDGTRFEPVLIRMEASPLALDTGDRFVETRTLENLSIDGAVDAIRALDLDLFVTGAYTGDWEKTSAILAHRLAPVQIWAGAVCPTTGGFSSFDAALTCRATEPEAPQRHYTEPLAWIEGPLQAAYAFPPIDLPPAAEVRFDLGVPEGATMLVSGAMERKITDELLVAWVEILRDAPHAVLVLYPFAPNWSLELAPERFRARLDRHLAAACVAPERAILLWTQPPERVRAILGAADLYLDSFPYTGATTVCEALASGTPVLTCAGDALRQLTGASWVRAFGLPEIVAGSPEAYVALARSLCGNPAELAALRLRLAATLAAGPPPHCHTEAFGAAFSDALWRIAEGSGLFPGLLEPSDNSNLTAGPDPAPPRGPSPPFRIRSGAATVRLLILASPRTGSTLLCDLLNLTPGVVCHYELFHEEMIWFADRKVRDAAALKARDADPARFLTSVVSAAEKAGHSLVGFKHFPFYDQSVTRAAVADAATRIICLGRANRLAQFSSLRIATDSGDWFGKPTPQSQPRLVFDKARFASFETYQRHIEAERIELLAEFGRAALFLDYVGLLDPDLPKRLARFLGIAILPNGRPRSQRQNTPVILDRFANPEEVTRYLADRSRPEWAARG